MPRRCYDQDFSSQNEPPRKRSSTGISNSIQLKEGEVVTDISNKNWKLGKPIGIGGFGEIYEATDIISTKSKTDSSYVAKIERHSNGPLFVEINCYLRIGKSTTIEDWKREKHQRFLGMPHYVASGSHYYNGEKYRFLVLPKYKQDLEQVFQEKKLFNIKTVSLICIQILDVLEYIHSKGYVHSDIKASNVMLGKPTEPVTSESRTRKIRCPSRLRYTHPSKKGSSRTPITPIKRSRRNLRSSGTVNYIDDIPYLDEVLDRHDEKHRTVLLDIPSNSEIKNGDKMSDHVYLLDYGLASKYLLSNGDHKEYCTDQRRAHAGTVLFCSRDAHKGVPSRRSDLETLAYNMLYWLTGSLPWSDYLDQPLEVEKKKTRCFRNLNSFLELSFQRNDFPNFVKVYFEYINSLQFEETPDYDYCRKIFENNIKLYGYKDDSVLDFDNLEGWGSKQKKSKKNNGKIITCGSFLKTSPLLPINSNIMFKRPKLRKKAKNNDTQDSMMNWSKILTDPETIIKQARERKNTEGSDPGTPNSMCLDIETIESMNPTYAMLEVFNKCKEREGSPRYKNDSMVADVIEGYTPAMMAVHNRMTERLELEYDSEKSDHKSEGRPSAKKRPGRKTRARASESPPVQRTARAKSQQNVTRKKDSLLHLPLKKAKSTPLRRNYRLRG
ncbi:unnamed protein product [Phaedon cochleariae]|uniref:non-specific serine/threonine protein kinase n=1 Tax=Phaedon cochleariae TaxID=80249 RepID=A0A9N9SLK6_PHACE|nr:unnamed protein product [Phaedon cochleariae]